MKNNKAFTLVELLVVIGIVGVLLAITLTAINPARQFAQANNKKRQSDVTVILNAINQYSIDQRGEVPSTITSVAQLLSKTNLDLCSILVPSYVAGLPTDPQVGGGSTITDCNSSYNTYYEVQVSDDRVKVSAPATELDEPVIFATR